MTGKLNNEIETRIKKLANATHTNKQKKDMSLKYFG